MGSQLRAFLPKWFDEFPWLHCLDGKDCVISDFCAKQDKSFNLHSCNNKEDASSSTGFSNWKKAGKRFREHQESNSHKTALTCQCAVPQCADALAMTNKQAEPICRANVSVLLNLHNAKLSTKMLLGLLKTMPLNLF